jgi:hypothetical protein
MRSPVLCVAILEVPPIILGWSDAHPLRKRNITLVRGLLELRPKSCEVEGARRYNATEHTFCCSQDRHFSFPGRSAPNSVSVRPPKLSRLSDDGGEGV